MAITREDMSMRQKKVAEAKVTACVSFEVRLDAQKFWDTMPAWWCRVTEEEVESPFDGSVRVGHPESNANRTVYWIGRGSVDNIKPYISISIERAFTSGFAYSHLSGGINVVLRYYHIGTELGTKIRSTVRTFKSKKDGGFNWDGVFKALVEMATKLDSAITELCADTATFQQWSDRFNMGTGNDQWVRFGDPHTSHVRLGGWGTPADMNVHQIKLDKNNDPLDDSYGVKLTIQNADAALIKRIIEVVGIHRFEKLSE